MGIVVTFYNQDGGSGKTSLTASIAEVLASKGKTVLLLDPTPKHSLSDLFTLGKTFSPQESLYSVFQHNAEITVHDTDNDNIQIAVGHDLMDDIHGFQYEMLLRDAVSKFIDDYDFILIDTANNGTLVAAALCASDYVMIPVKPTRDSVNGAVKAKQDIYNLNYRHGLQIGILEIVLNAYDDDRAFHAKAKGTIENDDYISEHFDEKHAIPLNPSVAAYQFRFKNVGVMGQHLGFSKAINRIVEDLFIGKVTGKIVTEAKQEETEETQEEQTETATSTLVFNQGSSIESMEEEEEEEETSIDIEQPEEEPQEEPAVEPALAENPYLPDDYKYQLEVEKLERKAAEEEEENRRKQAALDAMYENQ